MIGKKLSHYEILGKLGEGGMGLVYRARDTRLDRLVALKVLRPNELVDEAKRARFQHEARVASALNHPNVVTIYDVGSSDGTDFIAMEYVKGRTLRDILTAGPLAIEQLRDYGLQIADGLAAAHALGILHRDLKPANIMVTDEGVVKVVDFGLATARTEHNEVGATISMQHTQAGALVGTASYMSPEQAQGLPLDQRSDIFAFGVTLYEMSCGKPPFQGLSAVSILVAVLNTHPDLAQVQPSLRRVLSRALEKDRDQRYASVLELAADLRSLGANDSGFTKANTQTSAIPAVAVIPFANLSSDPENEYFSDGLTDEIINALTRIEALRVVARTTAFQFKGKAQDITAIGRQLNVGAVLEGSVRRAGDHLRVTAQLVNVADGYHLWSGRYDGEAKDVFDVQDEIARSIAAAFRIQLKGTAEGRMVKRQTNDLEAYSLYLRGNFHWHKQALTKAMECFEGALALDHKFAPAWSGLANCFIMLGHLLPTREALPKARNAALRALELDDTLAEAHSALGVVRATYDLDYQEARREFELAISLNPGSALVHSGYAIGYLAPTGQFDEAIQRMHMAQNIDPLSPFVSHGLGLCCYFARQYDDAMKETAKALDLDPGFALAYLLMGRIYAAQSLYSQALPYFRRSAELADDLHLATAALGLCLGRSGDVAEADRIFQTLLQLSKDRYVSPYALGVAAAGAGLPDRAMEWLAKAVEERAGGIQFLAVEPYFDQLRSAEGFAALVQKLRLDS